MSKKASEQNNRFAVSGNAEKITGVSFHDFRSQPTLRGVYVGPGKTMSTDNSEGEFETLAFISEEGEIVLIPKYKLFEKVTNEAAHGEFLYEITAKGLKDGKKRSYNDFEVQRWKLNVPMIAGQDYSPSDWM
jgi:hypothetical protein